MAGLAAARTLAEAGLQVSVLEASERVGGRILTVRNGDAVIELGAEFVHGQPPDLWALIEEAGLATYERTGEFLELQDGHLILSEQEVDALEALKDYVGPDCSFAEYAEARGLQDEVGYVEGFNAANAQEISVLALGKQQIAEDSISGERMWRVTDGYSGVPDFVAERLQAAGGQILFNAQVASVRWEQGSVAASCLDGRDFQAARAVIALPLGVLQADTVRFSPALPTQWDTMRMGVVCRFTLVFRKRLWPASMSFLLTPGLMPPVWWTAHPNESRTLTGWVGGPRARELSGSSLRNSAISAAASAFGLSQDVVEAELIGFHTHDWTADPYARGAYSWVPVGGLSVSESMSEPISDTLYFAGEHTDTTGHWGTVHAALGSGLRAARQILTSLDLPELRVREG